MSNALLILFPRYDCYLGVKLKTIKDHSTKAVTTIKPSLWPASSLEIYKAVSKFSLNNSFRKHSCLCILSKIKCGWPVMQRLYCYFKYFSYLTSVWCPYIIILWYLHSEIPFPLILSSIFSCYLFYLDQLVCVCVCVFGFFQ